MGRNFVNKLLLRVFGLVLPMVFLVIALSQTVFARTNGIAEGDRGAAYATESGFSRTAEGESAIRIRRGIHVLVSHHGEGMTVEAGNETVGQLLTRLNMEPEAEDVVSHPEDMPVYDGMLLRVDAHLTRQETYTETLHFETTWCADPTIPRGEEEVLIPGRDGEVLCTAEVTYINGKETRRKLLSEKQTIAPVTRVVAVGTGEEAPSVDPNAMPVIGDGYILLPTGEVLTYTKKDTVRATAYTHTDAGCDRITATGSTVHRGTVAVDPRFIPYGTRMFIVANDGSYVYGIAEAEDCGGAIKRDRMDLYFPTYEECIAFGWRTCTVYFLG